MGDNARVNRLGRLLRTFGGPHRRRRQPPDSLPLSPFGPVPDGGYLVGGAVRDALLGRPVTDLDWLVADPEGAARAAATALGGSVFPLDESRGHWRVAAAGVTRDYIRLAGPLEQDLAARDFTVNAIAVAESGRLVDPLGGRADLSAGRLRMTSSAALRADPLRLARAARLATVLGFELEEDTRAAVQRLAAAHRAGALALPAWERIGAELERIALDPGAGRGMLLLEELGLLEVYLPELAAGRGVHQGGFHHLDVLTHQLEALQRLADGFPEADLALRWATLLHDTGKPGTRAPGPGKRYTFYGHDRVGADLTRQALRRLRQPAPVVDRAAALVRWHMLPLPRGERAARRFVHRRRELLPDLLKLMIADREAARGPLATEAGRRAYRVALSETLRLSAEQPPAPPLLDGREVMELLGLPPGPRVGEALGFLAEARAVGDVRDRAEAVAALERYAAEQGWTE